MLEAGMLPCAKHFPGHGDTAGDSHTGAVCAARTREQIEGCELVPFRAAIDAGCPMVMVGHIETPNFAADGLPASLSPTMIGEVLRKQLGFDGLVVSDSFAMGAITQHFSPAAAATRFVAAGGDVILMPEDLPSAYQGLLDAVEKGEVSEKRLEESVTRVLAAKWAARHPVVGPHAAQAPQIQEATPPHRRGRLHTIVVGSGGTGHPTGRDG